MVPLFESVDYCEQLPVIDIIISFSGGEGCRMIGTGVIIAVGILLHEYSSRCGEGCISHDEELFGDVGHSDYWGGEESFF